ncbi:MAG: transporter substrate-binding domain-containing protein [Kiritimatiellae bacterium]|nr:transporter substrate-binding domain-containing protein [Kiritimatiellia bacterium]
MKLVPFKKAIATDRDPIRRTFVRAAAAAVLAALLAGCAHLAAERTAVERVRDRGVLLVGSTGDYRPLTWHDPETGRWEGFGIEIAGRIAAELGVRAEFVQTSWPTLAADVRAEPPAFDFAIGGITVTDARKASMAMSDGYLANGKTILCRAADAGRFRSLADVDRPDVRVMVNPGGLNEAFARAKLTNAQLLVHERNEEIPGLVAEGRADAMVTEIVEAPWYVRNDPRLAAPLLAEPFTRGEIGVLMRKGQDDLLAFVNAALARMAADGTLAALKEKHGLAPAPRTF